MIPSIGADLLVKIVFDRILTELWLTRASTSVMGNYLVYVVEHYRCYSENRTEILNRYILQGEKLYVAFILDRLVSHARTKYNLLQQMPAS